MAMWRRCRAEGLDLKGRCVLEVGTGHVPLLPLAMWLMGAGRVITIDLNRYVELELVEETLAYLRRHREELVSRFGPLLQPGRLAALRRPEDLLAAIEYQAPADAAATGLAAGSVDLHCSYTVLEHIPPSALQRILAESRRLLAPGGLAVHCVDYSDHFSHGDARLSAIHFLRHSERTWRWLAGHRFMYCNRLRHPEMQALFEAAGLVLQAVDPQHDERVARELPQLPLHADFRHWPPEVLAITGAWFVAR